MGRTSWLVAGWAAALCVAVAACGSESGADPKVQASAAETALGATELRAALLVAADLGPGFVQEPDAELVWRGQWDEQEVTWGCLAVLGELGEGPGTVGSATSVGTGNRRGEVTVANRLVSFEDLPGAQDAFARLHDAMVGCTRERGVARSGSEQIWLLQVRPDREAEPTDDRLMVRIDGETRGMGWKEPVAWRVAVARTANHLTAVVAFAARDASHGVGYVSDLVDVSIDRLASESRGEPQPQ